MLSNLCEVISQLEALVAEQHTEIMVLRHQLKKSLDAMNEVMDIQKQQEKKDYGDDFFGKFFHKN